MKLSAEEKMMYKVMKALNIFIVIVFKVPCEPQELSGVGIALY